MGKQRFVRPQKKALSQTKITRPSLPPKIHEHNDFLVCFSHLDCNNQGQSLQEAENCKMLSKTIDTIKGFSGHTPYKAEQVFNKIFTIYGDFPKKQHTDFTHPSHIMEDAKWAKLRLGNRYRVIGHVVGNVFYVVFFDSEHKFWKTSPKNT